MNSILLPLVAAHNALGLALSISAAPFGWDLNRVGLARLWGVRRIVSGGSLAFLSRRLDAMVGR